MKENLFDLNDIRFEINFKSFDELRSILSFYQKNNILKLNIPCKNNLKKDFLLSSIKIAREEFPDLNIIPHYSITHQFKSSSSNTHKDLVEFIRIVYDLGCNEILIISGSQKKKTLDSVKSLSLLIPNSLIFENKLSFGVALNLYLSDLEFNEEIRRLKYKLSSGSVTSIWLQFGTDYILLESRIKLLEDIIFSALKMNRNISNINLYGSILLPSRLFLARFKFRPWKGVFCSNEFLNSVEFANKTIIEILKVYKKYKINPIIETNTSKIETLISFNKLLHI